MTADPQAAAAAEVRAALGELDLDWQETEPGLFTVRLPGERKLVTECALEVGRHRVGLRAFVARRPEQAPPQPAVLDDMQPLLRRAG